MEDGYISQAAKFGPSTKNYEVSNRWKLLSQEHLQREATKKQEQTKEAKNTPKPEIGRQQLKPDYIAEVQEIPSVRQQAAMAAGQQLLKRERTKSGAGTEAVCPVKKKSKSGVKEITEKDFPSISIGVIERDHLGEQVHS
ncbi:hypothetical protein chiPu_0021606 [Chiloscyllium punctatum]|uniref:Uncharacterized protein n=1 Tax=Chiloscyllium punctatum TaxID=137246 RepID=A0A401RIK3_CHIPU|nr:hypothetical protein [Chiloscyllium punctatum]